MALLDNLYIIDDIHDLWQNFGIFVESGSDDFLKIPARKDSISHVWLDGDGTDVDLTTTFFGARTINLKCCAQFTGKTDFWTKYYAFIALLRSAGARKLTVTRHGKDYYVYYKENSTMQSYNLKVQDATIIMFKFTITFVEPKPVFV